MLYLNVCFALLFSFVRAFFLKMGSSIASWYDAKSSGNERGIQSATGGEQLATVPLSVDYSPSPWLAIP